MGLSITHKWTCDVCGEQDCYQNNISYGADVYKDGYLAKFPPDGWNWIDGRLICPKHGYVVEGLPPKIDQVTLRDPKGKIVGFAKPAPGAFDV